MYTSNGEGPRGRAAPPSINQRGRFSNRFESVKDYTRKVLTKYIRVCYTERVIKARARKKEDMQLSMNRYKEELQTTLENTEELYKEALAINDFNWMSEQVDRLYTNTWATIKQNAGENVAPTLYTDHDVREVKEVIISTAKELQEEAEA